MDQISGYQKRGFWALLIGVVMGASVLLHLETSRAKPSVEYLGRDPILSQIGVEVQSEPLGRAPASFPASAHN